MTSKALVLALTLCTAFADYALLEISGPGDAQGKYVGLFATFGLHNSTEGGDIPFVLAKPDYLGCKPLARSKGAVVMMLRGVCNFETKCQYAKKAGAVGCVVVNNVTGVFEMSGADSNLDIPAVMVGNATGEALKASIKKNTAITGKIVRYERPVFDASIAVLVLMAVGTVAGGAYWSATKEREGSSPYSRLDPEDRMEEEEEPAVLNEYFAWGFIVVASLGLVVLFYYIDYLIYVLVFIFCLAGAQGLFLTLTSLAHTTLPRSCIRASYPLPQVGQISWINTVVTIVAVGLAAFWGVYRKESFAWILQDILGIAFLLTLQKTVQLPNVKVAGILLVLAFLYDIFWVFLSPFFFEQSVMVKVATGGNSGEAMPMLLKMPRLMDPTPGDSLLGLGDIAIPGLYISYLLRFDYETEGHWVFGDSCSTSRANRPGTRIGFFSVSMIGYVAGLVLCDVVLIWSKMGQPALLYIVPCVLCPVLLLAEARGMSKDLWKGKVKDDSAMHTNGGYMGNLANGDKGEYSK
mmetsp:Transcript_4748/g.7049  ORF Transcript_4748/g.7049 Transcript_4748/m.7049 type:complete len:521 (+) Transcript_4748:51-1613(+)|eukprot:CAMPEP_0167752274 /NCGR_PEP_ID=MMETSP0110_2-20121227/7043_1 /TAXON_ID=629695 /ORGANISM="Gymnochlora sp., Strain CCMP2014" /LENGTH=520 /DNA_ID=CAMNT_0007637863 /DNA_START=30 /DNA_END=1592 /DNA_ORIENTATION=-